MRRLLRRNPSTKTSTRFASIVTLQAIQRIQTDNGTEFTYKYISDTEQCPFDIALQEAGIEHILIPPRTPWHNGKVERSHRLVWEDTFSGDTLRPEGWNIELHAPGWVNNELQEYTASSENVFIENNCLVLKAVRKKDGSYTSGRVSTQWKRDFTYSIFEARLKVPRGKGYLPAFWLMTTDEDRYGQWPRCGEIDIMLKMLR